MIILDTNVVSEPISTAPSDAVRRWVIAQPRDDIFTTAITQAEMSMGLGFMAPGKRRTALAEQIRLIFEENFAGRVLPFDSSAAIEFERLPIRRDPKGNPLIDPDVEIAAIARAHNATLATRNIKHFKDYGIPLINPWTA